MGLSGAAGRSGGGRPWAAATVWALALAVVLAQPVASWAWVSGAHVTGEQVALHEEAVAHGHAHHHDYHADRHHDSPEALGPVFGPGPDHMGPYQDLLNGALVRRPGLLSRVGEYRLGSHDGLSPLQNFPPVPHRPPITPRRGLPRFARRSSGGGERLRPCARQRGTS
jgi:hypothetical protein